MSMWKWNLFFTKIKQKNVLKKRFFFCRPHPKPLSPPPPGPGYTFVVILVYTSVVILMYTSVVIPVYLYCNPYRFLLIPFFVPRLSFHVICFFFHLFISFVHQFLILPRIFFFIVFLPICFIILVILCVDPKTKLSPKYHVRLESIDQTINQS